MSLLPTLVEVARHRAASDPDRVAFTSVTDGKAESPQMTFAELDQRARAIAAKLQALGACGERVLLIFPTGLDYVAAFYGCLYAGAIAVPAYPPDPRSLDRSLPRLMSIVNDCKPKVALTVRAFLPVLSAIKMQTRLAPLGARLPLAAKLGGDRVRALAEADSAHLFAMRWLAVDRLASREAERWAEPTLAASDIAYLQYTSGSTSEPKGVVISHGNALSNLRLASDLLEAGERDIAVGWVPLYHDLGLVCHVLGAPYTRMHTVLMSPLDFLRRPAFWLETISRYRGTFNAGPNFAYELCVRKTSEAERAALDLSCWRVAGNGGEAVRPDTLERFCDAFRVSGFRPQAFYPTFGLAEATLFAAVGKPAEKPPERRRVAAAVLAAGLSEATDDDAVSAVELASCGYTGRDHALMVVDPETCEPRPEGTVGEVWFSGPSVPQAYWNNAEATESTFEARILGSSRRFMRTGDMGFLRDGQLYITGRIKDIIIIRGRNHYPQDLESSAQSASDVLRPGCGAAFTLHEGDHASAESLVLVQELREGADTRQLQDVAAGIREALHRDHEVAPASIHFVKPKTLPKTSSGKLQRRACRAGLMAQKLAILASY